MLKNIIEKYYATVFNYILFPVFIIRFLFVLFLPSGSPARQKLVKIRTRT